jgi:hypothetical protein
MSSDTGENSNRSCYDTRQLTTSNIKCFLAKGTYFFYKRFRTVPSLALKCFWRRKHGAGPAVQTDTKITKAAIAVASGIGVY